MIIPLTATALTPLPIFWIVVVLAYGVVVTPHWKETLVLAPFGLTVPFNTAEVKVTVVAALVVQTGFTVEEVNVRVFP